MAHNCYLKKGPSGAYLGQDKPVLKKGVVNKDHAYHLAIAEIIENRDEIIRDGGLFMTFTSDPCLMETYDLFAGINFWACNHGIPVTILTKCAYDIPKKCEGIPKRLCFSPFCISSKMLAIGWTLTGHDELEPNAATNSERLRYMKIASDKGMMTWASIEPVIDFPHSLDMIYQALNAGCQHFKIGLLTNNTHLVRKDFQIGEYQFKAYDVRDCLHFIEDVMRLTAGACATCWRPSILPQPSMSCLIIHIPSARTGVCLVRIKTVNVMTDTTKRKAPRVKGRQQWPVSLNIAYCFERTEDGSGLVLSFVGATGPLIDRIFRAITAGGYLCREYHLDYKRVGFSSQQLCYLVEQHLRKHGHIVTQYKDINKFLNI